MCPHLSSVLTKFKCLAAKHSCLNPLWTYFLVTCPRLDPNDGITARGCACGCRRKRRLSFFAIGSWLLIYWCREDLNKQFSPIRNRPFPANSHNPGPFFSSSAALARLFPSSETQGQIVWARESLNGRKNMAWRKVKNGEMSRCGQCLTVWNWSGKTLSPGALLAVLYFSSCHIFRPFRLSLAYTVCPWVSEDGLFHV